jgi:nucleotide-binding universal stress UspA family protein
MYKHILVPTDGSPLSLKAAKEAAGLAKSLKARVTALFVIPPYSPPVVGDGQMPYSSGLAMRRYKEASEKNAAKALDKVEKAVARSQVRCEKAFVTNDAPWAGIIGAAKARKCDLIVMASHGRGGLAGLILGSETTKVLAHSRKPVLVCR